MTQKPTPAMFANRRPEVDPKPRPVKKWPVKIRLSSHVDEETLRRLRQMKGGKR